MLECPHGCMHDQFCIKFPNHHCCMCVMEIMWDLPLFLNCWPNRRPDMYHVQPFYKPWGKILTHDKPWPRVRMSILALRRKQKKKKKKFPIKYRKKAKDENSQSKIGRKQNIKKNSRRKKTKEIYKKVFRPDNIWTIQNCHKQIRKERKPQLEVVLSLWLPTKILCVGDFFAPH